MLTYKYNDKVFHAQIQPVSIRAWSIISDKSKIFFARVNFAAIKREKVSPLVYFKAKAVAGELLARTRKKRDSTLLPSELIPSD